MYAGTSSIPHTVDLDTDRQIGRNRPGRLAAPLKAGDTASIQPAAKILGCYRRMNTTHVVLTVVALLTQAAAVALLFIDSRRATVTRAAYAALSPHGGTSWDQIDHAPDYILKSIEFHTRRNWAMACAAVGLVAGASAAFL